MGMNSKESGFICDMRNANVREIAMHEIFNMFTIRRINERKDF